MGTRYEFMIQGECDAITPIKMYLEVDEIIKPQANVDTLLIMEGYPIKILDVIIAPSFDPIIFVTGASIYVKTQKEANDLAKLFNATEGWKICQSLKS